MKEFAGRVIAPGTVTAPALVSHGGLNTLASIQKALLFGDKKAFDQTPHAARLKATGVVLSCICPLMYMNNPLAGKMPVITCSNKLRTYTTARFYTEDEILGKITRGGK